jgi:ABC-2 type transport system ATP-binding protein
VLFSSHLLGEVERVSDRVAMIQAGRIVFCDALDDLKESHCRLTLRFAAPRSAPPLMDGALAWQGAGREWTAVCSGRAGPLHAAAAVLGAEVVHQSPPTLDEIFVARAGGANGAASEE